MPGFPVVTTTEASSPSRSSADESQVPAQNRRIRVKNRRFHYLEIHPEYYKSESLELADPLLYDRLIRAFQSPQERQQEQVTRGYSSTLLSDLERSEAKLEALAHPDPNNPLVVTRALDGSIISVEQDPLDRAKTKEEGCAQWKDIMGQRFMRGDDRSFEYRDVDENEEYDDRTEEERSIQEEYFKEEEEKWINGEKTGETGIQDF